MITVKVGKLPGILVEVSLNGDRTVRAALTAAEMLDQVGGNSLRVNTAEATLDTIVSEGDSVLIVNKVKGNL